VLDNREREALTLEAVKLAVELGVDVNAANLDGRRALDAAKRLGYETVAQFLVEKGAKPGQQPARQEAPPKKEERESQPTIN
jgi:ankyrin repeat protein